MGHAMSAMSMVLAKVFFYAHFRGEYDPNGALLLAKALRGCSRPIDQRIWRDPLAALTVVAEAGFKVAPFSAWPSPALSIHNWRSGVFKAYVHLEKN